MSINAVIGWLGITSLLACAFHANPVQQKIKDANISASISQVSTLNELKMHVTMKNYPIPPV